MVYDHYNMLWLWPYCRNIHRPANTQRQRSIVTLFAGCKSPAERLFLDSDGMKPSAVLAWFPLSSLQCLCKRSCTLLCCFWKPFSTPTLTVQNSSTAFTTKVILPKSCLHPISGWKPVSTRVFLCFLQQEERSCGNGSRNEPIFQHRHTVPTTLGGRFQWGLLGATLHSSQGLGTYCNQVKQM